MRPAERPRHDADGSPTPLERLSRPRFPYDVDVFLEQLRPLRSVHPGHLELVLGVADADDEADPAAGDEVGRGDLLGKPDGIVER